MLAAVGLAACQFDASGGALGGAGTGGGPPVGVDAAEMPQGMDAAGGSGGTTGMDASSDAAVQTGPLVGEIATSGCSTTPALALATQIAEEIACTTPSAFARFSESGGIHFADSTLVPYLTPDAISDLQAVAGSTDITITAAFRTLVEQYLYYRWSQESRCGIGSAAMPGYSIHETGRVIAVSSGPSNNSMATYGWNHIPSDATRFEHTTSADLRGEDVSAFQRLWNRNHPQDLIIVDGAYGPMTESRLLMSPAGGFPIGACGRQ